MEGVTATSGIVPGEMPYGRRGQTMQSRAQVGQLQCPGQNMGWGDGRGCSAQGPLLTRRVDR